jgi:hypothetical protein
MKSKRKVSRRSSGKGGKVSIKANPRLWESIKKKVMSGSKGGPKGKWSGRKAQMLVKAYKAKGGKFKGKKSSRNSLSKWSREKWDYINKSGRKSKRGRYLPEKVRRSLTPAEKRRENKKKGSKRGKNVKYSRSVNKKMKKYKIY